MQPTPESPPAGSSAPPAVGAGLVEFIRADRQRAAYALLTVAAVLLLACGWAVFKASAAPAVADKPKAPDAALTEDAADAPKVKDPSRYDYIVGALLAGAGLLVVAGVGGWLLASVPPPEPARGRTDARAVILGVGGALGALLIVAGVVYYYRWSESLAEWLDKGQRQQARYALGPLLAVVVGGGLMFLAVQPARAEERNNRTLRRLIYGSNTGLSVLLLFVVLVVFNLIVGPRLPNKLDTTDSQFYSLSGGTKEYLGRMPERVSVYAILQDGRRDADDIRRLLQNCRDESGGKFEVKFISAVADQTDYRALSGKYPVVESNEYGVLVTVGDDEKRHSFIRDDEFSAREGGRGPGDPAATRSFVGESRLMKEVLFLSESEQKAAVYFTQSAGELDIGGGRRDELGEADSAVKLKEYLTRNYLDVRPLKFDPKDAKVPDDAAVVIVAQPTQPLADAHVAALRKYMTEPRPGNKKGKLIVLAGAAFGPPPKNEVLRTGLEGLLAEFNVRTDQRLVIGVPTRELPARVAIAGFAEAARRAKNPIAVALGTKAQFLSLDWREVAPAPQPGPAFRATPLLYTATRDRFTWLEDRLPTPREVNQIINDLNNSNQVRAVKRFSDDPRPVGVVVTEGEAGRLVVVGNGLFVSDGYAQQAGGEPPGFDFVGGSVDWLRDRPPLSITGVEAKRYKEFNFPATTDRSARSSHSFSESVRGSER